MNAFDYYKKGFTEKYADFSGRARRSEYWYFILFNILATAVTMGIDALYGYPILYGLYTLAAIVPSLAVAVRRLHDTNKSGWFLLISFIPLIGGILLLVWFVKDSDEGINEYGPNPKGLLAMDDGIIDHLVE